jgi:hypothetical protein
MADKPHKHGDMDITEQEKTFEGFVRILGYAIGGILVALVLLYAING